MKSSIMNTIAGLSFLALLGSSLLLLDSSFLLLGSSFLLLGSSFLLLGSTLLLLDSSFLLLLESSFLLVDSSILLLVVCLATTSILFFPFASTLGVQCLGIASMGVVFDVCPLSKSIIFGNAKKKHGSYFC